MMGVSEDHQLIVEMERRFCITCAAMLAAYEKSGVREAARRRDTTSQVFHSYKPDLDEQVLSDPSCQLCNLLRNIWPVSFDSKVFQFRGGGGSARSLKVIYKKSPKGSFDIIEVAIGHEFVKFAMLRSRSNQSFAPYDQAFITANSWINSCHSLHPDCHLKSDFVPTRMLDIGTRAYPTLRLIMKSGLNPSLKHTYVTLSHCWGSHVPLKLLNANLEEMTRGINFYDLPKLFQDTVQVARKLNQRYLWIDSLCIIQDSASDWQNESRQMDEVYKHSLCNICATIAEDSLHSLFQPRETTRDIVMDVRLTIDGFEDYVYHMVGERLWRSNIENAILNSRAWVCQERFLSPCNLHFAGGQVFWECKLKSACEVMPSGFGKYYMEHEETKRQMTVGRGADVNASWLLLLRRYSRANLTYQSDRLIAIAGLAASWSADQKIHYIAGLWKENICFELLWNIQREQKELGSEYVAPSWSWASVKGSVAHDHRPTNPPDFRALATFLNADIEYANQDNAFGQVLSGKLTLKAPLGSIETSDLSGGPRFVLLMTRNPDEGSTTPSAMGFFLDYTNQFAHVLISGDPEIFILPLIHSKRKRLVVGLVLKLTSTRPLEFRRLGLFSRHSVEDSISVENACERLARQPLAKKLNPERADHGHILYNVTLV